MRIDHARRMLSNLKGRATSEFISTEVHDALNEYLNSLTQWSIGSGLGEMKLDDKDDLLFSQDSFERGLEIATLLQSEDTGCVSCINRPDPSGNVFFFHLEEDGSEKEIGDRFDKARVVKFEIGRNLKEARYSFIYPDLLPGPAFGYGNRFFYSVDTQSITSSPENSILANAVTWIAWRLGDSIDPEQVIKELLPTVDSYTLNSVRFIEVPDRRLETKRIDFGSDRYHVSTTSVEAPSLVSVNLFDPSSGMNDVQAATEDEKQFFMRRMSHVKHMMELMNSLVKSSRLNAAQLLRLLTMEVGGEVSMIRSSSKAHVAGLFTTEGNLYITGASGPAVKGEAVQNLIF